MANVEDFVLALRTFFDDPNVRFPVKPRLVEDLSTFQMPDGLGIQFRGGPSPVVFRGQQADRTLAYLLPALDGTRTLDDLLEQCPPDISEPTLLKTLSLLHTKGLLIESNAASLNPAAISEAEGSVDETVRRQLLFWGRTLGVTGFSNSAPEAQYRLESSRVVLLGTGLFGATTYDVLACSGCVDISVLDWDDTGFMLEALHNGPIPPRQTYHLSTTSIDEVATLLREMAECADLVVMATRNAPAMLFRIVNRICLDHGCPFLCANEDGTQFEIGPYVRPYGSACYRCMELRRASIQDFMVEEHLYQEQLARERPSGKTSPIGEAVAVALLGSSLVALEVVRIITGLEAPTLLNAVLTVSALSGRFSTNRILRVPRCPECARGSMLPEIEV